MSELVTVAGAYELSPGRFPGDDVALFRAVLKGALHSWPIQPPDIDGLMTSPCGGISGYDRYFHDRLVSELGLRPLLAETINRSLELGWIRASGLGKVTHFSVVHQPPSDAFETPYVLALIQLDEGVRMMSNVKCDPDAVRIGLPVRVTFEPRGRVFLPMFVPR